MERDCHDPSMGRLTEYSRSGTFRGTSRRMSEELPSCWLLRGRCKAALKGRRVETTGSIREGSILPLDRGVANYAIEPDLVLPWKWIKKRMLRLLLLSEPESCSAGSGTFRPSFRRDIPATDPKDYFESRQGLGYYGVALSPSSWSSGEACP